MHDLDWDDLRFFLAVSERGSISGAAKFLNVNHSTVLRRLASLEKRLGVRVFDRLPDGWQSCGKVMDGKLHSSWGLFFHAYGEKADKRTRSD